MKLEYVSAVNLREEQVNPVIVAIDAMDFSDEPEKAFKTQLERKSLERELGKAFTGFASFREQSIDTGHWGCGAFCGKIYF